MLLIALNGLSPFMSSNHWQKRYNFVYWLQDFSDAAAKLNCYFHVNFIVKFFLLYNLHT